MDKFPVSTIPRCFLKHTTKLPILRLFPISRQVAKIGRMKCLLVMCRLELLAPLTAPRAGGRPCILERQAQLTAARAEGRAWDSVLISELPGRGILVASTLLDLQCVGRLDLLCIILEVFQRVLR